MKEWIDWWEDRGMLLEGNGELSYIESGCYFQSIMGDSLVWCPCEKMHVQCTEQTALKGIRRDIADAIQFPSIRVISLPKAAKDKDNHHHQTSIEMRARRRRKELDTVR